MVGYSDSAKDVGRLAAGWDLYRAQEEIVAAGRRHGVEADAVSWARRQRRTRRRADPSGDHVAAAGSIDGTLRVTEQGEMLQALFGLARHRRCARSRSTRAARSRLALPGVCRPPRVAQPAWIGCATPPRRAIAPSSTSIRISSSISARPRLSRAGRDEHRQPARRVGTGRGDGRGRDQPARHSVAVRLDADATDARRLAGAGRCARRARSRAASANASARCIASGRTSAARSI